VSDAKIQVDTLTSLSQLTEKEAVWSALLREVGGDTLHVSVPWLRCWWDAFGGEARLCCLIAREGDTLVGIAPMMIEARRIGPLTIPVLCLIGNDLSPRSHVVFRHRSGEVWRAFVQELIQWPWTVMEVGQVPEDCEALSLLAQQMPRGLSSMQSRDTFSVPRVSFDGSWEEFLRGKSQNFRRSLRRTVGKNTSTVVKCFPDDGDSFDTLIGDVRAISQETWKQTQGTSLAADERSFQFYERMMAAAHAQGNLLVTLLDDAEMPVAFKIFIAHHDLLYGLKTGYRLSHAEAAPGFYLMAAAIQMGFETHRWRQLDMDTATSHGDWKYRWATHSTSVVSYYVFRSSGVSKLLECVYRLKKRVVPDPPVNAGTS